MKRAIIAGATGAIGTALVDELVKQNIEVLVLVRKDSNRKGNILDSPLVSVLECGMQDYAITENNTGKIYDVFYHFAWAGAAGPGRHDMYLQNDNVKYALDAVGLAKRFGCKCFIGAGSQAEYGRFEGMLTPYTPAFPEMGYGYAKLCAGQMTREYANQLGLSHIWVRVLSVYGPNDGAGSMIMSTIDKLKRGEKPKFTKGEQMWDYLYSKDAAVAFRLLGEKGKSGETYVLGCGSAKPLKDYILTIRDMFFKDAELGLGEVPYGEKQVMFLCADISKLTEDTGWKPEVAFADGIKQIVDRWNID